MIAVVGPTAAGKTALGVEIAAQLGGEVINADSMQLYRGMDIGTAKATPDERGGVPHHLLDVWDVTVPASVAEYQRLARACIDELLRAGRVPVLVGGSGLYVRAALDDLRFPGTDPQVRDRLESELLAEGPAALHRRLAATDPAAAAAISSGNGRRIVRALEVAELTGGPFVATLPEQQDLYDVTYLAVDRPDLDDRIERRVQQMWDNGFVDEVQRLSHAGLRGSRTASRALGYAQILTALAGKSTLDQAKEHTVTATRRFARRQRSWFRRDARVRWMAAGQDWRPLLMAGDGGPVRSGRTE